MSLSVLVKVGERSWERMRQQKNGSSLLPPRACTSLSRSEKEIPNQSSCQATNAELLSFKTSFHCPPPESQNEMWYYFLSSKTKTNLKKERLSYIDQSEEVVVIWLVRSWLPIYHLNDMNSPCFVSLCVSCWEGNVKDVAESNLLACCWWQACCCCCCCWGCGCFCWCKQHSRGQSAGLSRAALDGVSLR